MLIVMLCGLSGVISHAVMTQPEPQAHEPRSQFGTYAPDCSEFVVEYEEEDWNEVTETYPANHAWQDCMNVGYN